MGELEGVKNAWGYPEGGNGAVSMAIARAAEAHGAVINTDSVSVLASLVSGIPNLVDEAMIWRVLREIISPKQVAYMYTCM